eukprot:TRINITY_DN17708_c2_g1_i2.p2 TRINITY_DN17708_c2_g1~~TRINITY_DN17708_c2_g1_i2.p2  ORF type:complete len:110 (+),score=0.51 TRINITY_DN17708_c2_g1_i2:108-437(+)
MDVNAKQIFSLQVFAPAHTDRVLRCYQNLGKLKFIVVYILCFCLDLLQFVIPFFVYIGVFYSFYNLSMIKVLQSTLSNSKSWGLKIALNQQNSNFFLRKYFQDFLQFEF